MVVWTIVLFSVATAALGLTQSYWQFAIVRFISALGLGAEYVVCNTLMAEYVPTERRTTVLGTLQAGWSVGYVVATVLAGAIIPVYGWRPLFATAIVPVLLALFIRRMVPEPPGWKSAVSTAKTEKRQSQWKAVFASPQQRRIFVLWTLTSCFLQFGYDGEQLAADLCRQRAQVRLHQDDGLPGRHVRGDDLRKIVAGYLADIVGRRWMYVFGGLELLLCSCR